MILNYVKRRVIPAHDLLVSYDLMYSAKEDRAINTLLCQEKNNCVISLHM